MPTIEDSTETTTTQQSESSLRRKAARLGYRLTKLRSNSTFYSQYGPFMISDASTNAGILWSVTLDYAAEWLLNAPKADTYVVKPARPNERRLESALYRLAKAKGLALIKYRSRTPSHPEYGHYCISVRGTNIIAHSTGPRGFGLTLNDVAEYLKTHSALQPTA